MTGKLELIIICSECYTHNPGTNEKCVGCQKVLTKNPYSEALAKSYTELFAEPASDCVIAVPKA